MRFVIQNVTEASVCIDGRVNGSIGRGFAVLIGIAQTDTEQIADKMMDKMFKLRVFEDENGKTNRSLIDVGGSVIVVSQFTLYADTSHGRRPGFSNAARPELAEPLYERVVANLRAKLGEGRVGTGRFGAEMKVRLLNDGPFSVELVS